MSATLIANARIVNEGQQFTGHVLITDPKTVCGVKVFMGSSTGNMLVDSRATLEGLFSECP